MPRNQCKDRNLNSQDNVLPPELSNPTTVCFEKCNIAEAQDKGVKTVINNMFKDIKADMNKSLNEVKKITKKQL